MNYGILISYIVAGFLMITILTITYNVTYSNQEVTTTLTKSNHTKAVKDIIMHDIPNIGYQKKSVLSTIFSKADSNEISFYSNIDDQGSVELVTWKYTNTPAPGSKNPNDRILERSVNGDVTEITNGVTHFKINYYDTYGSDTPLPTPISGSNYDDIVQIEVEMELQSEYELSYDINDPGDYVSTSWRKRLSPVNLRPNN
jgi:hypothetical protein